MKGESKSECSTCAQRGPDPAFERLAEKTFKSFLAMNPVEASRLGVHGKNDAVLPDRSAAADKAALDCLRSLLHEYETFDPHRLSSEQSIELSLARGALSARIALEERRPASRCMPQVYLQDALSGIYLLMIREHASTEVRARGILGRLKAVPAHLQQARTRLESPPAVFTESALLVAEGMGRFCEKSLGAFLATVQDATLRRQCERASLDSLRAVREYSEYLRGYLMTRSTGEFRVGKAVFNRLLRDAHRVPFDADELVVLGEKIYHETLREVRATAGRIRAGCNWSRLFHELREDHPDATELLSVYAAAVQAAREHVLSRGLALAPQGERISTELTPEFARPFYPYAGYVAPAPLEVTQEGTLWVTPPDSDASPAREREVLRGHPRHGIPVFAVHEAYPGHHLQSSWANQVGRKLRLLFATPVFIEGWALYCEDMMYREGFYQDERVRMHQLCDQLWRSCRVIVDVGLHTGKLSPNEAVALLVRKAKLDRHQAMAEVRRYCESPTQPMSYVVGKLLLQELLEDYRIERGERGSLLAFHSEVLSQGSLPIDLIRKAMNVPRRRAEREMLRALSRSVRPVRPGKKAETAFPTASRRSAGVP